MQLVEHCGNLAVDVLGTVVGMEPDDDERQRDEHLLQHRDEERLGDPGHGADMLELGDFVDQVDVVDALHAVPVTLMHRVHAHVAGLAGGVRPPTLADAHRGRPRVVDGRPPRAVSLRPAQVVQVGRGQPRQPLEARIAEHLVLAAQHLAGRGTAELAADLVGLGQQADVRRRVHALERPAAVRRAAVLDPSGRPVLPDQARDLGARQPRRLAKELTYRALARAAQRIVIQTHQSSTHEPVGLVPVQRRETHFPVAVEKAPDLLHRAEPFGLQRHDHPPNDRPNRTLQAHLVPVGHKFGHVFYAAASKGCSLAWARSMRCSNESRSLRVNFHSKGWAMAS